MVFERCMEHIEDAIAAAAQDALAETRTVGRAAFVAYANVRPDRVHGLLGRLEPGLCAKLREAMASAPAQGARLAPALTLTARYNLLQRSRLCPGCGSRDEWGMTHAAGKEPQQRASPADAGMPAAKPLPRRHSALPAPSNGLPKRPASSKTRHSTVPTITEAAPAYERAVTAPAAADAAHGRLPRGRKSMGGAALRISLQEYAPAAHEAEACGNGRGVVNARRVSAIPPPAQRAAAGAARSLALDEAAEGCADSDSFLECSSSRRTALPGGPSGQGPLLSYAVELILASSSDWKVQAQCWPDLMVHGWACRPLV